MTPDSGRTNAGLSFDYVCFLARLETCDAEHYELHANAEHWHDSHLKTCA
ncbi:rplA family protein [Pseudomonas syringae pv. tomato]|nr:rplA family protein [Pseudomonas syringae pv. tomato]